MKEGTLTLSVGEAARRLGVSEVSLYAAIKRHEMDNLILRCGRRILVSKVRFEQWVGAGDDIAGEQSNKGE